jgi:hypothetical protein
VLAVIAMARGDRFPQGALLAWGIGAGVAGGLALTCFYGAVAGAMGASAALSGLLAAAIPAGCHAVAAGFARTVAAGWVRGGGGGDLADCGGAGGG